MNTFLTHTLAPFDSAAVLTGEGEVLDIKYETLADIGTLGPASTTVVKYFRLEMGDVVLLNDPYSGGTILSSLTLVTPLAVNHPQVPNLYLSVRTGFRPRLVISKTLEEEGLRIPPTPIAQRRGLNTAILSAISSHPLCPEGLQPRLEQLLQLIWKRVDGFQVLLKKNPQFFNRSSIKTHLQESQAYMRQALSDLPSGECKVETHLDSGELIRLRLELSPEVVECDFSGTSASPRVCLTDASTLGACFGALAAFLQKPLPLNSGVFSLLHVTSPLGCLLNAKYPSPTFKGMTEGTSLVAGTMIQALSEIVPQKKMSTSAQTPTQISFEFSNGKRFFDSLPGGVGATATADGADAIHYWIRNRLQNSVQEIERRFPLLIHSIGIRKDSGGKGHFRGGHGLTKEYELLQDAKLHWILQYRKHSPKGIKGAQGGEPPEILIQTADGKKTKLEKEEGALSLAKGTRLFVSSAGGGGYGKGVG